MPNMAFAEGVDASALSLMLVTVAEAPLTVSTAFLAPE